MKTRIISGTILFAVTLVLFILGGDFLFVAMLAVSIIGLYELYRLKDMAVKPLSIIGYIGTAAYYFAVRQQDLKLMLIVPALVLVAMMTAYVLTFPRYEASHLMLSFFGVFYVGIMLSFVYRLREMENGAFLVWIIVACSWVADTCAYFVGVKFGKHKITPQLSPKKTLEGALGGIAGAAVVAFLFGLIFRQYLTIFTTPALQLAAVAAIGAFVSMIGDLTASGIKRNYDIKDFGNLIPGHGGILDRFDSVIIVAPLIYGLVYLLSGNG